MTSYIPYMIIMAGVTYLIRLLPITLCQKEIKNIFIKSFLFYMPYAVLGCMTFPAIFSATGNIIASSIACIIAIYYAYREKSLIEVAFIACISAYIIDLLINVF